MIKLITANPYSDNESFVHQAWADGYVAGQKSTLTTVSVTGRWGQSSLGNIWFVEPIKYESFQYEVDTNPGSYRWLSDEETRKFK